MDTARKLSVGSKVARSTPIFTGKLALFWILRVSLVRGGLGTARYPETQESYPAQRPSPPSAAIAANTAARPFGSSTLTPAKYWPTLLVAVKTWFAAVALTSRVPLWTTGQLPLPLR